MPVLFALLQAPQERVQASALGAIQGVCFVPSGRHHIRSCRQVYFFIHDRYDDLNRCAFFIMRIRKVICYYFYVFKDCFIIIAQNIERLCGLMLAKDGAVRARALGSVHNLSVDIQSIVTILGDRSVLCYRQYGSLLKERTNG